MIHRCIVVLLGSSISLNAWAASSVLVWPIFQTISASDKGSELWLENRGATAVNLQLRIFGWDQKNLKIFMPIKTMWSPAPVRQCSARTTSTYSPDACVSGRQRPGKIISNRD